MACKNVFVRCRIDHHDHEKIKNLAKSKGFATISNFMRYKIIEEDFKIEIKLTQIERKINQIIEIISKY